MSNGLRKALPQGLPGSISNPGLVLQRYVPKIVSGDKSEAQGKLFPLIAEAGYSEVYAAGFDRWKVSLSEMGAATRAVTFAGHVIVGMGAENVLEASITTHPIYGMPIIPGSALKGLARHFFGDADAKHAEVLFGDRGQSATSGSKSAGYVRYFDAWWIPDRGARPFKAEVLTTHHPRYYGGGRKFRAPTDFDDPTPIPFLSASGRFLLAVSGPTDKWTAFVMELVEAALADWGVGAKTSSGFGRTATTSVVTDALEALGADTPSDTGASIEAIKDRIAAIKGPQDFSNIVNILDSASSTGHKRETAELLRERIKSLKRWRDDTTAKVWRVAIEEALQ